MFESTRSLFIISFCFVPILFVIWIGMSINANVEYLNITENNKEYVYELLEDLNMSTNDNIKRVGYKQGLGDWYLYIDYEHITDSETIIGDDEGQELYDYIKENNVSDIDDYFLVFVFIMMILFIIYDVFYIIVRIIQKSINVIDRLTENYMNKEFEKDKKD